jgi:phage tail sheath protein FI
MPTRPSHPGVYLQEAPGSPPAIAALPTAVTAFVGHTPDGPVHQPLPVHSRLDFERLFGGLAPASTRGPAVLQIFDNGGTQALVVRLPPGAQGITAWLPTTKAARARREGIYALEAADHFNLLCLPPPSRSKDFSPAAWARAAAYCQQRRALLLVDAPSRWNSLAAALNGMGELQAAVAPTAQANSAAYFPRLRAALPAAGQSTTDFAPCAAVAGLMARTDAHRGVWKAPAGSEATLSGMEGTSLAPTETQLAELAAVGLNAVRSLPGRGLLVWGARTLAGHNALASEWKYVPVRRLALHIEQSVLVARNGWCSSLTTSRCGHGCARAWPISDEDLAPGWADGSEARRSVLRALRPIHHHRSGHRGPPVASAHWHGTAQARRVCVAATDTADRGLRPCGGARTP